MTTLNWDVSHSALVVCRTVNGMGVESFNNRTSLPGCFQSRIDWKCFIFMEWNDWHFAKAASSLPGIKVYRVLKIYSPEKCTDSISCFVLCPQEWLYRDVDVGSSGNDGHSFWSEALPRHGSFTVFFNCKLVCTSTYWVECCVMCI